MANEPVLAQKPAVQDDLANVFDKIEKKDTFIKVNEENKVEAE